jgi:hypothetical protein
MVKWWLSRTRATLTDNTKTQTKDDTKHTGKKTIMVIAITVIGSVQLFRTLLHSAKCNAVPKLYFKLEFSDL